MKILSKILWNINNKDNVGKMFKVCLMGMILSSFTLTLVSFVMKGFEAETYKILKSIHPDLIIRSDSDHIDFDKLLLFLNNSYPEIIGAAPWIYSQVIVQSDNSEIYPVIVKAVDPKREATVTFFDALNNYETQDNNWDILNQKNSFIIGCQLASKLSVNPKEDIQVFSPEENFGSKISFSKERIFVSSIFKTGINELDENLIFCSIETFESLFKPTLSEVGIRISKKSNIDKLSEQISKDTGLKVSTWKQLYPALFNALNLEKWGMFVIMCMIALISAGNIFSLLFMFVFYKKRDIAILKSMGLSSKKIKKFLFFSIILLSTIASFIGSFLAIISGIIIKKYKIIDLPDIYYSSTLPVDINIISILNSFLLILIFSLISSLIPLKSIDEITISRISSS